MDCQVVWITGASRGIGELYLFGFGYLTANIVDYCFFFIKKKYKS